MKVLKTIAFGALALAFTACSNEPTEPANTEDGANQFMTVNLGMATGSQTMAATDGGYAQGSAAESSVKLANSIFLFYDANGNYLTSGTIIGTGGDFLTLTSNTGNVENRSEATIVLGPTAIKPAQVLAVLNYADKDALKNKTLSDVLATVENTSVSSNPAEGDLILTNSVYYDGKVVNATAISAANICETADAAKKNPVEIYVERTVAKVQMAAVAGTSSITDNGKTKYVYEIKSEDVYVDNAKVQARIVVDGWKANAINESGNLIKSIDAAWNTTAPFDGWNLASDFRSFWAQDANYTGNDINEIYDFTKTHAEQAPTYKNLEYFSWNECNDADYNQVYLHENTVAPAYQHGLAGSANSYANVTSMLIAAHLETSADGNTWTKQNLFRQNGIFYTEASFKTRLVNTMAGHLRWVTGTTTKTYTNVAPADLTFTFTSSKDNKSNITAKVSAVTVPSGATLERYNVTKATWESVTSGTTTFQDVLDTYGSVATEGVTGWNDGACYYQVPIEHLTSTDNNPFWGLVRNHVYELTLSNIARIGSALWDKDEELVYIPGKEKNYYVAARLNILSWKSVKQDVVIE